MSLTLKKLLKKFNPNKQYCCISRLYSISGGFTELMFLLLNIDKLSNPIGVIKKYLLNHPEEINKENNIGWTPLMLACIKSSAKIIKILLKSGANINVKGKRNETPLFIAGWYYIGNYNEQPIVVQLLINAGADISWLNCTDMNLAVVSGPYIQELWFYNNSRMAKILLNNYGDDNEAFRFYMSKAKYFLTEKSNQKISECKYQISIIKILKRYMARDINFIQKINELIFNPNSLRIRLLYLLKN